jgi:cytochrome oxidase Cu insertion factor (SCO1/SenC/PrrC family)
MNRDFAATRKILRADSGAPKNWQFLSISFDPDFDTAKTLSNYADFYRDHDRDRWLFVSASAATLAHFAAPLGLMIMKQGNSLSHNLRTLVSELNLSARAYDRILKVSRTIADLADAERVDSSHLSEAIQYRTLDRQIWG